MKKPRILLIEDDVWLAHSYTQSLGKAYSITVVNSSHDAINSIDTAHVDVIVADVMLENGLVFDLLHELQSHSDTMSTPVIMCSSLASSLQLKDLVAYGVVALLDKSLLTPDSLRVAVQRALSVEATS